MIGLLIHSTYKKSKAKMIELENIKAWVTMLRFEGKV